MHLSLHFWHNIIISVNKPLSPLLFPVLNYSPLNLREWPQSYNAMYTYNNVIYFTDLFSLYQLKTLTQQQLEEYMAVLDQHMAQELETLRKRYHHKRLPILQAMDAKKKQQFRN